MRAASTDECVRLDYLFPRQLADKLVELSGEFGRCKIADGHECPESFRAYAIDALADDPEAVVGYLDGTAAEPDEPAARPLPSTSACRWPSRATAWRSAPSRAGKHLASSTPGTPRCLPQARKHRS